MAKRAFSIVELLVVVSLTAMTIGITVALYGYSVNRLAQATSRFAAVDQVRKLHDEIDAVVRDSVAASTVATGSGTALKCLLAYESKRASNVTTGSESKTSLSAKPVSVTKRGYEKHGAGKRVWFFLADSSGAFGSTGTTLWRAERNDDSTPTVLDVVSSWRFYPGTTNPRFNLVTSLGFVVNTSTRTVTTTVGARSLWRDERTGTAAEKDSQSFTEARTTGWRHWFQ